MEAAVRLLIRVGVVIGKGDPGSDKISVKIVPNGEMGIIDRENELRYGPVLGSNLIGGYGSGTGSSGGVTGGTRRGGRGAVGGGGSGSVASSGMGVSGGERETTPLYLLLVSLPDSLYTRLSPSLHASVITLVPVLFTQGINEQQSKAIVLGQTEAQDRINIESLYMLRCVCVSFL